MQHSPSADVVNNSGITNKFSCMTCKQRKVKCDKLHPCSNCTRASTNCVYSLPDKPKRKRVSKEGLHAKLRRYEDLLKSSGVNIDTADDDDSSEEERGVRRRTTVDEVAPPHQHHPGPLDEPKVEMVHEADSSRLFENSFWYGLRHEYEQSGDQKPVEAGQQTSIGKSLSFHKARSADNNEQLDFFGLEEHSLVLGASSEMQDLSILHPVPDSLRSLWEIFLDRVDPLVKILHTPTAWSMLTEVLRRPSQTSKSSEALRFAIYSTTICSLEEDECQRLFRDTKSTTLIRYRRATRQALVNAGFIKSSSLITLQAYMLFLLGAPGIFQSDSFYVLSGIAVRLARRMGLHRDGTPLGFLPFETEMRRRLWWQVVHVDSRASDISGTKRSMDLSQCDTKPPSNVFDEDLIPSMTVAPTERVEITPIVLSLVRCDLGDFFRKITSEHDISWDSLADSHLPVETKEEYISEIQDRLESKYLRYCDPSNALHFFTSILVRSAICKARLVAHNPRQYAQRGMKVPQQDRDIIWANAIKLLDYGNLIHITPSLTKFTWQMGTSYLWDVLLYILIETRDRKIGPAVDKIWQLILSVFKNYPRISQEHTDTLCIALGRLTVQVWDDCATARKDADLPDQPEPPLITTLRRSRAPRRHSPEQSDHPGNASLATEPVTVDNQLQNFGFAQESNELDALYSYDFSNLLSFDLQPSEWEQWDRLLSGQAI